MRRREVADQGEATGEPVDPGGADDIASPGREGGERGGGVDAALVDDAREFFGVGAGAEEARGDAGPLGDELDEGEEELGPPLRAGAGCAAGGEDGGSFGARADDALP